MIKIKAWNARNATVSLLALITYIPVGNSRAIAKFHNVEIDYFGLKLIGHDLFRGSVSQALRPEFEKYHFRS